MATLVEEYTHVMSNVDNNNNKFWRVKRYDNHIVTTEWARVGEINFQSKDFHHSSEYEATNFVNKKRREKEKKGYLFVEVVSSKTPETRKSVGKSSLENIAISQIAKGDKKIESLVKTLVQANIHTIVQNTTLTYNDTTGLFSTAVGVVSKPTLDEARDLLKKINDFVIINNQEDQECVKNIERFLMRIPQKVGRKLRVLDVFPDISAVQKQSGIIDSLEASLLYAATPVANDAGEKPEPVVEQVFDVRLYEIDDKAEIKRVTDKYYKTLNTMHIASSLKPRTVYGVEIKVSKDRFDKVSAKIGNVQELWHGTRVGNLLSILRQGLIIPPANASHCCGRAYGNGIYGSDQSSKSLNYSDGRTWHGTKENYVYMFLADFALGKQYIPQNYNRPSSYPVPGYNSTYAKPGVSGVQNSEYICYDISEVNLTRLIEFV